MNNKFFNIFLFITFLFEQSFSALVVSKNNLDTIFELDSDLESNSAAFNEFSSNKKPFNAIFQKNDNGKVESVFNKNDKKVKNINSDNSGNDSESTNDGEDNLGIGYGFSSGSQKKVIKDKNGKFVDKDGNQIDLYKSYVFYQDDEDFFDESDNETLIGGLSKNEIKENLKIIYKKKEMQNKKLFNKEYYQELKGDSVSKYREKERRRNKEDKITKIKKEDYEKKYLNEEEKRKIIDNFMKVICPFYDKKKIKLKEISFNEVVKVKNFKLDREERKLNNDDYLAIIKNRSDEFRYKINGDNKSFYYYVTINNKENKIYLVKKIYYKDGRNRKVNDEVVWIGEEEYYNGKFLDTKFINNNNAILSFISAKEKENELERQQEKY